MNFFCSPWVPYSTYPTEAARLDSLFRFFNRQVAGYPNGVEVDGPLAPAFFHSDLMEGQQRFAGIIVGNDGQLTDQDKQADGTLLLRRQEIAGRVSGTGHFPPVRALIAVIFCHGV